MLLAALLHRVPLLPGCFLAADFGVAAWKLHARQRRQLGGVIQHHMRHWQRGRTAPHRAEAAASSDSEDEAAAGGGGGGGRVAHAGRTHLRGAPAGGHQRRGHLLHTSYLLDREVFLGLKRVQAALEALPLQDDPEDWEAAVSGLAHAIDQLGELAAARAAREVA